MLEWSLMCWHHELSRCWFHLCFAQAGLHHDWFKRNVAWWPELDGLLLLVGFWIFSHSTRILLEWGNYLFQISGKIFSPHMIFGVWTSFFLIMGVRMTIGTLPAILLCCVFFYSLRRGFQESGKVLTFQNARSQPNNSASSTSQTQSKFVYVWEFLERDDRWLPFLEDQQVKLEDAYCRKDSELRLPPRDGQKGHRWGRVVSFAEMTQRNEETGKVRNVRRRREPKMIDDRLKQFPPGTMFPLNTLSRAACLERRELLRSQPDFDTLVRIFKESMTSHRKSFDSDEWCPKPMVEVIKIEEVVNPLKQRLYEVAQDEVGSRNPLGCGPVPGIGAPKYHPPIGHVDLNEYFLFHGTNYDNVRQIIEHGLDPQRGGSASARFGYGTYFAENASKSDFYTTCDQCAARPSGVWKVPPSNRHAMHDCGTGTSRGKRVRWLNQIAIGWGRVTVRTGEALTTPILLWRELMAGVWITWSLLFSRNRELWCGLWFSTSTRRSASAKIACSVVHDIASVRLVISKEKAAWQAKSAEKLIAQEISDVCCRQLQILVRHRTWWHWGHIWVKVWEVFRAMAVLSVDLELPLEVVGRLRFPESRPRQLEVCQMVHWNHVLGFMFTLLVPNIVKNNWFFWINEKQPERKHVASRRKWMVLFCKEIKKSQLHDFYRFFIRVIMVLESSWLIVVLSTSQQQDATNRRQSQESSWLLCWPTTSVLVVCCFPMPLRRSKSKRRLSAGSCTTPPS